MSQPFDAKTDLRTLATTIEARWICEQAHQQMTAAPSSSSSFHVDNWLGGTSNCPASRTSVRSPLIAAIATFALKADVWFRRGLLLMLFPDLRANLARRQAEAPPIALCRFSDRHRAIRQMKVCRSSIAVPLRTFPYAPALTGKI